MSEQADPPGNQGGILLAPNKTAKSLSAQDVPQWKRLAQVVVAIVYCFLAAGTIFGFAALKPVLVAEQVYRNKCTQEELREELEVCYGQEMRLNLMFIVAAVTFNIGALMVGAILDRYGPFIPSLMGCAFIAAGSLFMAFASPSFDGYIPGYFFMALGGPFVFTSSFQLSNAFPRYSGLILALLTGAFDSSTAIPLFFKLGYDASDGTLSSKKFFLIYLVVPAFIFLMQLVLMPKHSYKLQEQDDNINGSAIEDSAENEERENVRHEANETSRLIKKPKKTTKEVREEKFRISGVFGALHGVSAWRQMLTPWFIFMSLFTIVQMLRINYFCATIRSQYKYLFNDRKLARKVNDVFDVALPAGGVVASPFIGVFLDNTSATFAIGLLVALATIIGVLGVLPFEGTAYANIFLFVIYRPLLYSTVSDYAAKVFGFDTFGKVWGMIIFFAGIFNFAQSGFDVVTHTRFNDDPVPVNLILLFVVLAIGIGFVGYVWYQSRKMRKARSKASSGQTFTNGDAQEHVNGRSQDGEQRGYGSVTS